MYVLMDLLKASQKVRIGDEVRALTTGGLRILIVVAFAQKRGPYSFAKTLYEDKTPPPVKRDCSSTAGSWWR